MKKTLVFIILLLACQSQSSNSSSTKQESIPAELALVDEEPANMRGMVAAHNKWRKEFNLPPLTWSNELAQVAQKWANKLKRRGCKMQHSSGKYGENLYWSSGMNPSPEDVVASWAEEKRYYNFNRMKCKGHWSKCGHYTQLIWKNTKRVGCAMVKCGGKQVWVCNYDPPGNYVGEKPF